MPGVKIKTLKVTISEKDFDLLSSLGKVEHVLAKLADHAAQGVRRPGAWENEWIKQAFGNEFEDRIEQDPATHGLHYTWFRTIGTNGVKTLALFLFCVLMIGCGKAGQGGVNSAASCGSKSVFSEWRDNGSNELQFTGLNFGTVSERIVLQGIQCDVVLDITGDQCSGTFNYKSSVLVAGQGILTTVCDDQVGNYDYTRSERGIVYGRRGSRPEEFH